MTALRCPCECNSGGFCGGCGHAGCSGGINVRRDSRDDIPTCPRCSIRISRKGLSWCRNYDHTWDRCGRCGAPLFYGEHRAEVATDTPGNSIIIHAACLAEKEQSA